MDDYEPQGGEVEEASDEASLLAKIKGWVTADIEHSAEWRKAAKDNYDFIAGRQWTAEELEHLKNQMRPVVTFNKTKKFVKSICGLEVNNRQAITFLPSDPKELGEVKANEVLSNGSDWMARGTDASRKESRSFRDVTICGMGWVSQDIDYDDDPLGKYVEERCNPLEMGWDCNARDDNLADSKRRWQIREMSLSEARALIPGVTDGKDVEASDLDASWAGQFSSDAGAETKTKTEKERREEAMVGDTKRRVKILRIQWWEYETFVKTVNPKTGEQVDMPAEEFETVSEEFMAQHGQPLPAAHLRRKVYKQAFVGGKILKSGPSPRRDGFTFQCVTGDPDDNKGTWDGVVSIMRDPQVYSNKFFAQIMHMINSTAKGGILAEDGAFKDINQAQATYARPESITITAEGAIKNGRIMPKPGAALTAGVLQLLQVADSQFPETTGMNLELMGMADRQQAGVLEAQRKQAAMTILASMFDNMSAFRRDIGACRLTFMQDYLADGRLIRVHGQDGEQAIPLIKDQTLGKYDVIVDDAPNSTNMKEKAWAALMTLLPAVQDMLTPQVVVMLLDYVPNLPSRLVEELKKIASEPPPPEQVQAQQAMQKAEIEDKQASGIKKKTAAVLDLVNAASKRMEAQAARIQAVDAELADAGLIDLPPDQVVLGAAPVEPIRPQFTPDEPPAPAPVNPAGAPNIALPGGLMGS